MAKPTARCAPMLPSNGERSHGLRHLARGREDVGAPDGARDGGSPACGDRPGRPALGASSHRTALPIRIAVMPSASAWWIRQISALPPPARLGITSIRHSGRDRSSRCSNTCATVVRNTSASHGRIHGARDDVLVDVARDRPGSRPAHRRGRRVASWSSGARSSRDANQLAQRSELELVVEHDHLAGVTGNELILEREDAQILGRQQTGDSFRRRLHSSPCAVRRGHSRRA